MVTCECFGAASLLDKCLQMVYQERRVQVVPSFTALCLPYLEHTFHC